MGGSGENQGELFNAKAQRTQRKQKKVKKGRRKKHEEEHRLPTSMVLFQRQFLLAHFLFLPLRPFAFFAPLR
jgi:hypothetical protein